MAVAFGSSSTPQAFTGSGSWVLNAPSGVQAGDTLIAVFARSNTLRTITSYPVGWTQLESIDETVQDMRLIVACKVAAAGEPSTYTFGWDNTAGQGIGVMLRYSGGNGIVSIANAQANAADTTPPTPSVTPTRNGSMVIGIIAVDIAAAQTFPHFTPPTGWTERVDERETVDYTTISVADILQSTAASITADFTQPAGEGFASATVAVVITPSDDYLLENGTDRYLLEDGSGVLLLDEGLADNYDNAVMPDYPMGYWKLDETSGTQATDSSGRGNHGTYVGTPTLGQAGNGFLGLAAEFDPAIPEYVTVPDDPDLDWTNGPWTVEAWFRLDTTAADPGRAIFSKANGAPLIRLTNTPTADIQVIRSHEAYVSDSGGGGLSVTQGTTWHYVAVVYAGGNGAITYYLDDGTPYSVTNPADFKSNTELGYIGRDKDECNWDGRLQRVAVYNQALSATRIAAHYSAGSAAPGQTITVPLLDGAAKLWSPIVGHTFVVRDTFTDTTGVQVQAHTPDIRPGSNMWTAASVMTIDAAAKVVSSSGFESAWITSGVSDCELVVTMSDFSTTVDTRLQMEFRIGSSLPYENNMKAYFYRAADGGYIAFGLQKTVANVGTTIWEDDTFPDPGVGPHVMRVVLSGSSVSVYFNDVLLHAASTVTDLQTNTIHGFGFANGDGAGSFDDFGVLVRQTGGAATQTITLGLLDGAAAVYAPTLLGKNTLTVPLLDGAATLYAPTVIRDQFVTLGLLDGGATLYAPTVIQDQFVTLGLLDGNAALYAPTVVPAPVTLSLGLIDAVLALYDPVITSLDPVGQAVWTTPADGVGITATPSFAFTMPYAVGPMHFQMEIDDDSGFGSSTVYDSSVSQTGWEYWNGSSWTAVPSGGVSNSFSGNEARYTVQSPLSPGTYYRRVRAGVAV